MLLSIAALLLLVLAPPKENFSFPNFYGFLACLYFRTVKYDRSEVVALLAREHRLLVIGSTRIVYSVYSQRLKLYFTDRLQGAAQLAAIVAEATGLSWMWELPAYCCERDRAMADGLVSGNAARPKQNPSGPDPGVKQHDAFISRAQRKFSPL